MPELILYHYPLSPFAEKTRAMLGYAGLEWYSVRVAEMPPRPVLKTLTGGYRKIPVAQIGADVFCDTRAISRAIARLSGKPELALENNPKEVQEFVREADLEIFLACLIASSGFTALRKLVKQTSLLRTLGFLRDRMNIGRRAKVPAMKPKEARERMQAHLRRLEGMLETDFLFGDQPCIGDFAAYHSLWYVRDVAEMRLAERYPRVNAWISRIQAFGHGQSRPMTEAEALGRARDSQPRPLTATDNNGLKGQTVSVAPVDYGRDPVRGTLELADDSEWVISRQAPEVGLVHVHFPRDGFALKGTN